MDNIVNFEDFTKVDIRVGTIIEVTRFKEAVKPSYKLLVDFGRLGKKKSSAQITKLYKTEDLLNKQVLAVVNLNYKQIANFNSECLILGAVNQQDVTLLVPDIKIENGSVVK